MTVTGAPSANQPFEDEEAHYQHHRDLQIDPSTLSRLSVECTTVPTEDSGSDIVIPWDTVNDSAGTDLEIDGNSPVIIRVAPGVYAITLGVAASGLSGEVLTDVGVQVNASQTIYTQDTFDAGGLSYAARVVTTVQYLTGPTFQVQAFMSTDPGVATPAWRIDDAVLYVQRLA